MLDIYYLDNQKWGKIVKVKTVNKSELSSLNQKNDVDYVFFLEGALSEIDRFAGVVNENTTIDKLYFEYSQNNQILEVDDLLEVFIRCKKVFYQVINACTDIEKLESYNEKGTIVGEAIQLGCWDKKSMSFNKMGWVPLVNEAVYIADTQQEEKELKPLEENEIQVGIIPKTKLPSIIKLDDAVSHHMAILGVTGSGKSVFARKIIKEIIKDTKVICVDFTGEYVDKLKDLSPIALIDSEKLKDVEKDLAEKETEQLKGKSANKTTLIEQKRKIQTKLSEFIANFIESKNNNLSIFELPELSNTTFIL